MKLNPNVLIRSSSLLGILTVAALIYVFIQQGQLTNRIAEIETKTQENNKALQEKVGAIETTLLEMQQRNEKVAEVLEVARTKSAELEEAFSEVNSNVATLEKLTTTDPELLQKYSKIYFLNEHYVPEDLKTIPDEYVHNKDRTYKIHASVWPYLKDLLRTAEKDGVSLEVISAFRSFEDQAVLKGVYSVTYGAGTANQFSADQGYSEHQLGTTVDFTTPVVGTTFSGFAATPEFAWLEKNAYRFGFILSYPKDNAFYQFEPWHWRFVGTKLARDLHKKESSFYETSQREIDEYIIYLFE